MEAPHRNSPVSGPISTNDTTGPTDGTENVLSTEHQRSHAEESGRVTTKGTEQGPSTYVPAVARVPSPYYIVVSISGIERSNVKNPIIRFDAKVKSCSLSSVYIVRSLIILRQTFLGFELHL